MCLLCQQYAVLFGWSGIDARKTCLDIYLFMLIGFNRKLNFGQGSFSMDMIISEAISHFSSKFDYDEVKNFFSGVEVGPGMQSLQQSLERIRANIRWRENTEASVIQWLQKNVNFT
ncbi:Aminopeptidase N, partial [Stegodyphus mimosarum]